MATFFFETITAAQALGFTAATDTLVFSNPTSSGSKMTVLYNAATATSAATITLIDNADGHAVTFGSGLAGEGDPATTGAIVFPDGSNLFVGTAAADAPSAGTPTLFADGLFGGTGNDTLDGSGGNDLLQGNQGDDQLTGGVAGAGQTTGGNDTIFGGQGDDSINVG
ncbi:MAG: calcium-binding protein, partial [Phenylobacterium sp.]